jgi:hypothetical protein
VLTDQTVEWLVQEVRDLLDASSVGLYEFMELLDDPDRPLSASARQDIARRALERILADDDVELRWMRWPDSENRGTVPSADLPPDPWLGPGDDGRYLALARV